MKFSVIVPVYNAEKYLKDAIESVLVQTYDNYEIILINDGSTDASGEICDHYREKYKNKISVIHQENKGQLLTRHSGIHFATGDYCIFLDSDDMLEEKCLRTLYDVLREQTYPDLIIYNFKYYYGKGEVTSKKYPSQLRTTYAIENKNELYRFMFESTFLNNMWTKAIKTSVYQDSQFNFEEYSSLRCAEDRLQSMFILLKVRSIVCISEELYIYRMTNGSVTRNYSHDSIKNHNTRQLCNVEKQFLDLWGIANEEYTKKMEANHLNQAMYTLKNYFEGNRKLLEQKKIISYDWCSFVEGEYFNGLFTNEYVNSVYKKMWRYVLKKKRFALYLYLKFRQNCSMLKAWKRKWKLLKI